MTARAIRPPRPVSTGPDFSHEHAAMQRGFTTIAGVDEAGRGPLAGPVVVAAVVLDPDNMPKGLRDSKKLTPSQRAAAFAEVMACARAVSIATAPPAEIDTLNILRATLAAMRRAVLALPVAAD
ncbi:MAG: ribonuclease HII, partial [Beijerinckiaceae bacterium]